MKRAPFLLCAALAGAALGGALGCAALRHQHAPLPPPTPAPAAPGHDAPSADFLRQSAPAQLAHVHGEVSAIKKQLAQEEKYNCCVEPWCNECLLRFGECHCREQLREEGPCCGECTEAWLEGRGQVEGIDAWEVVERAKRANQPQPKPPGGDHQH